METPFYEKVIIRTEDDLPKEEKYYYWHRRISKEEIVIWTNHCEGDEEYEVLTFDWYFRPYTAKGSAEEILKANRNFFQEDPFTDMYVNDKEAILKCMHEFAAQQRELPSDGSIDLQAYVEYPMSRKFQPVMSDADFLHEKQQDAFVAGAKWLKSRIG